MYHLNYMITIWVICSLLQTSTMLVDAMGMVSFYISKGSGGQKCCTYGSSYGDVGGILEAFDDGTPLSFYRAQVSKIYGGGGHGESYDGGDSDSGHKDYGGGGYSMKPKYNIPSYQKLYKNSFRYSNIMMGGGFMKGDAFGPFGRQTSKKWRGYGKYLIKKIKQSGGGYFNGDKLTFVQVVPSGATDEYKDSYVTLIADSMKKQPLYNY